MMGLGFSMLFLLLLSLLGAGVLRLCSMGSTHSQSDLALNMVGFVGMAVVLHTLNLIQFLAVSPMWMGVLLPLLWLGVKPVQQVFQQWTWGDKRSEWQLFILVFSAFLSYDLMIKPQLPIVAWDSWLGWELKAKIWMSHGFSVPLLDATQWLNQKEGVYNVTAHYPDGLPLLYYIFQYLGDSQNTVMGHVYPLIYFWLVFLFLLRLKRAQADWLLLLLSFVLLTGMPLVNSHINLQGYADVWMAMVLLMSVFALSDWNQNPTITSALVLVLMLSLLPLFKTEGWVWMSLLLLAQMVSKFLIRRHRIILLGMVTVFLAVWLLLDSWSFSWAARSVVISQSHVKLGHFFELSMMPADVTKEMIAGLFLQNNWGLLWYFMPLVFCFWLCVKHPKHQQVTQTFFVMSFAAFLFLFFFTDAAQWAENYTAVNRVVLQLTAVFIYLLVQVFLNWQQKRAGNPALNTF